MGYRILETDDIPAYLSERGHWEDLDDIAVREVSDGNMNRVFLASSADGTRSLAVKQALPWVRVAGPSWYGTHTSARIGELVAQLSFATSDFGMPSAERKALIAASVSPELCKITEDVVLSEPYLEHEHNHWHEGVADLAVSFRTDAELRTEVAELRHLFMTGAQALLHGDLHTGSVMVSIRDGAPVVRVFDPEFSFVGPIGFDLGLYWVNALVSEERARALGGLTDHADQLRLSWKAFEREFRRLWPTRVDTFFDDAYLDRFLRQVWTESLGYAGTEIIRRIIGFAHLTDLTTLEDPVAASRRALFIGRELIVNRRELTDVESVRAVVQAM